MGRPSLRPLLFLCVLCASCNETPKITFGGGPAGPAGQPLSPGDPAALYNEAFNGLAKPNNILRNELNQNTYNRVSVREALRSIQDNLRTMESLLDDPYPDQLNAYIRQYADLERDVMAGNLSPGARDRAERIDRNVRLKFHPSHNLPLRVKPRPTEPVAPPATTGGKKERVDDAAKAPADGAPPPPPAPVDGTAPTAAARPAAPETPYWILYNAWKQAHDELAGAYTAKQGDYETRYVKVRESLGLIRTRLPQADQKNIDTYLNEYQRIHAATGGFLRLPEGQSEPQIRAQLDGVARAVELTYNPEQVQVGATKKTEPK